MNEPALSEVQDVLDYNPETGVFIWKNPLSTRNHTGDRAGTKTRNGYRVISIKGKKYPEHQLAWFISKGYWSDKEIDHINQVRDDNRLENLREVTHLENSRNRGKSPNNTGLAGIWFNHKTKRYISTIRQKGKKVFQKSYSEQELDLAVEERKQMLIQLGFHENHGN